MGDSITEGGGTGSIECRFSELIAQIVVATPTPRLDDEIRLIKVGVEKTVTLKNYVDAIREVTEYYSIPVLDFYKESGFQPKVPVIQQMYMPDRLHPNADGHVILADKIVAFFKSKFN